MNQQLSLLLTSISQHFMKRWRNVVKTSFFPSNPTNLRWCCGTCFGPDVICTRSERDSNDTVNNPLLPLIPAWHFIFSLNPSPFLLICLFTIKRHFPSLVRWASSITCWPVSLCWLANTNHSSLTCPIPPGGGLLATWGVCDCKDHRSETSELWSLMLFATWQEGRRTILLGTGFELTSAHVMRNSTTVVTILFKSLYFMPFTWLVLFAWLQSDLDW